MVKEAYDQFRTIKPHPSILNDILDPKILIEYQIIHGYCSMKQINLKNFTTKVYFSFISQCEVNWVALLFDCHPSGDSGI